MPSSMENLSHFADDEMGEGDFGWDWLIKAWTVLHHNVCFLEGKIVDEASLIGNVEESQELEGRAGCWS